MDADGDGVGDLEGLRGRLDHLAWLGVDAIWLSPIFPSPMADFGYDVADYCDIDPLFGDLAGFDRLLADAHARDIRVILDWVPSHTSDQHAWFRESRSRRESAKRDWYVWRDPRPGGAPPNNWWSMFGGSAWQWDEATEQFYLHSFLPEQPDLDWRNPEVVAAQHDVLRFWMDRGVDGFRIDVIQRIAKDPALRSNPELPGGEARGYFGQEHRHDENHPDVHGFLRGIRGVLDEYPERMAVGEVYVMDPKVAAAYQGDGDQLHLAFNFSFLQSAFSAESFRTEVERFEAALAPSAWPNLVLSNHDVVRHASRHDHPALGEARARLLALLLLALRGTPFLYYGEEIGMRNVAIPDDRLRDPLARSVDPRVARDPERTPIPWSDGRGHGFTTGTPWLPFGDDAGVRNVEAQRDDPASLLRFYRALLELRRGEPVLYAGSYASLASPATVFAWERRLGSARAVVAANFGETPVEVELAEAAVRSGLHTGHGTPVPDRADRVLLGPAEGVVLLLG